MRDRSAMHAGASNKDPKKGAALQGFKESKVLVQQFQVFLHNAILDNPIGGVRKSGVPAHAQEVSKAINKRNEQRAATLAQRSSHSHLLKQKVDCELCMRTCAVVHCNMPLGAAASSKISVCMGAAQPHFAAALTGFEGKG